MYGWIIYQAISPLNVAILSTFHVPLYHTSPSMSTGWQGKLVGGFNPFEKYARQNGSFPQIGIKIKNVWVATT